MGKTGEEAPKKRELFLFSSPFFCQISPLFAGDAKAENFGAKRERDWRREDEPSYGANTRSEGANGTLRPTGNAMKGIETNRQGIFPDRNTALSEKVAQRGLKVPLWACAREKNARSRARVERNAYICTSYMAPIRHPAHPLPNR